MHVLEILGANGQVGTKRAKRVVDMIIPCRHQWGTGRGVLSLVIILGSENGASLAMGHGACFSVRHGARFVHRALILYVKTCRKDTDMYKISALCH